MNALVTPLVFPWTLCLTATLRRGRTRDNAPDPTAYPATVPPSSGRQPTPAPGLPPPGMTVSRFTLKGVGTVPAYGQRRRYPPAGHESATNWASR